MSDTYKIVTPENIEIHYEIAGIGSRFLAIALDTVIQWLMIGGVFCLLKMLKLNDLHSRITHWSHSLTGALLIALILVILIGYPIILETVMNGQTVGKRLVNIRVRREGGYALSFWNVLLRNVIRLIDFMPFSYGLGFVTMFFNTKAKRLGDYAAGTIVVKELPRRKIKGYLDKQKVYLANSIEESLRIQEQYPWLPAAMLRMTQTDYLLIKNLLVRRKELTNIQQLAKDSVLRLVDNKEDIKFLPENDVLIVLTELLTLYEKQ